MHLVQWVAMVKIGEERLERGKWPHGKQSTHTGQHFKLQKSHKMHEMQSGNKLQKEERNTEKSKHVHLPLYRSIPPPLPFIQSGQWMIWAVGAERQLEQTEKVVIHIHTCRSLAPLPLRLFYWVCSVNTGQWTAGNRSNWCKVWPVSAVTAPLPKRALGKCMVESSGGKADGRTDIPPRWSFRCLLRLGFLLRF